VGNPVVEVKVDLEAVVGRGVTRLEVEVGEELRRRRRELELELELERDLYIYSVYIKRR